MADAGGLFRAARASDETGAGRQILSAQERCAGGRTAARAERLSWMAGHGSHRIEQELAPAATQQASPVPAIPAFARAEAAATHDGVPEGPAGACGSGAGCGSRKPPVDGPAAHSG